LIQNSFARFRSFQIPIPQLLYGYFINSNGHKQTKPILQPYEPTVGGNSHFSALTAITISVRLLTFKALRIALT